MTPRDYVISELAIPVKNNACPIKLLQNWVHRFLASGGQVLVAESDCFWRIFVNSPAVGRIDWIPDLLFGASEPWQVDEMSSFQICCIGTLARSDTVFCDRLKKELASYYSPASLLRTCSVDHLFETIFGPASMESHFRALDSDETYEFLSLLCRTGSVAMIKFFIDFGVDVNGVELYGSNMLGDAAAAGNVDVVKMLLEVGANGSLAIAMFVDEYSSLSDPLFRSLLELLVEGARPAPFNYYDDPLFAVIRSSRALRSYPMAAEILFNRNICTKECFGESASGIYVFYSYMFQAISGGHPSVVDLLLRNGACGDARISASFRCIGQWLETCTWLTFAVMCGKASCADVLIQHGADVTALDGAGKSAIQLAKQNLIASHPRHLDWPPNSDIAVEQDTETLVIVERAFNRKFQGTMSIEDYLNSRKEIAPQPSPTREKSTPPLQKALETALRIFLTPSQTELLFNYLQPLYWNTRKIWSLPFHETLLMRSMYVVSYAILFVYEICALIKGRKRIPMPSRFFLSALALLALAVLWGTS